MWLYVPDTQGYSASLPEGEDWTEESAWLCQALERSATWRTSSRQSAYWSRMLRKGGWMTLLCGRTPSPSTADHGVEQWISSWRDTPASPSPMRESSGEWMTPATSGPMSFEQLSIPNRMQSSAKTLTGIFEKDSSKLYSQTLNELVTEVRRRSSFLLKRWVRPISESVCSSWLSEGESDLTGSSWPTPTAHDGARPGSHVGSTQNSNLGREAETWPTPTARDANPGAPRATRGHFANLSSWAGEWATPTGKDRERGAGSEGGVMLGEQAKEWPEKPEEESPATMQGLLFREESEDLGKWPTPNASEAIKSGTSPVMAKKGLLGGAVVAWSLENILQDQETMKDGSESSTPEEKTSSRRLNHRFVEWLMGWPEDWTSVEAIVSAFSETE